MYSNYIIILRYIFKMYLKINSLKKDKKMKQVVLALSLCGFFGVSGVFAKADFVESTRMQNLSQTDVRFLFGTSNVENLNVRILSKEELKQTKGMWANFVYGVAGGFVLGFGKYTYDYLIDPAATIDWGGAFDAGIDGALDGLMLGGIWKGGSIIKGALK